MHVIVIDHRARLVSEASTSRPIECLRKTTPVPLIKEAKYKDMSKPGKSRLKYITYGQLYKIKNTTSVIKIHVITVFEPSSEVLRPLHAKFKNRNEPKRVELNCQDLR